MKRPFLKVCLMVAGLCSVVIGPKPAVAGKVEGQHCNWNSQPSCQKACSGPIETNAKFGPFEIGTTHSFLVQANEWKMPSCASSLPGNPQHACCTHTVVCGTERYSFGGGCDATVYSKDRERSRCYTTIDKANACPTPPGNPGG